MAFSVRLSNEDALLFRKYAELHGISLSDLIRYSVLERIEGELDLKAFSEAMAEFQKNPMTYSHEEVGQLLANDEIQG